MKHIIKTGIFAVCMAYTFAACAQSDKAQRPSPLATVEQKVGDANIKITYSQPSVKGRTIGKDLEPMDGKVWRTGANEATVFETDKDIKVEGITLKAGKYGFFTLVNGDEWTIIFNSKWDQWGAMSYKEAEDILRVKVKASHSKSFSEKFTITIDPNGTVTLLWGDRSVTFRVK